MADSSCQQQQQQSPHRVQCSAAGCQSVPSEGMDYQQVRQQSLQSSLQCGICLNEFSDPRALPCLHTFCAACIVGLPARVAGGAILCPMCRSPHRIADLSALPKNFFIAQLRDAATAKASVCSEAACNAKSVAFCDCCSGSLCLRHMNAHSETLHASCRAIIQSAKDTAECGLGEVGCRVRSALDALTAEAALADEALTCLAALVEQRRRATSKAVESAKQQLRRQEAAALAMSSKVSAAQADLAAAVKEEDLRGMAEKLRTTRHLLADASALTQIGEVQQLPALTWDAGALADVEAALKCVNIQVIDVDEVQGLQHHASSALAPSPSPLPLPSPSPLLVKRESVSLPDPCPPLKSPRALVCSFRPIDLTIARCLSSPLWGHKELGLVAAAAPALGVGWRLVPSPVLVCVSDAGDLHLIEPELGEELALVQLPAVNVSRICECPALGCLIISDAVAGAVHLWRPPQLVSAPIQPPMLAASVSIWQPRGLACGPPSPALQSSRSQSAVVAIVYVASPGAVLLFSASSAGSLTPLRGVRKPLKSADAVAAWPDGMGFAVSDCASSAVFLFNADCEHLGSFACRDAVYLDS